MQITQCKLGYGGTQEEMKRLLKDAEAISGVKYDISSYADIVSAIHVIQEEMDIAGTTAKEASETISGSWSSLKAAWSNTLTSLILGGDDFDRCLENLIESAKTFGKNIMPALLKALEGVGKLIEAFAPIIEKELPTIVETLLPPLIKAATALVKGLIVALPGIISTLVGELPYILQQVWEGISEAFGDIPGIDKVGKFFTKLKDLITENTALIKKIIPAALGLVLAIKLFNKIKGISSLFGGGGGAGGSGGGFFSGLAKMNPKTALKGILNLAIILGGLSFLAAALMAAAPYMAQLSDLQSIAKVLLVIGAVGLIGTAMAELAGKVGSIPVATVLKGVANIAIALVGFGALAAVLMWLAPYMAQLSDIGTTAKILLIIGMTALVGAGLAGLAGLIGVIPITAVLTGLANIALALGGFAGIATAFGALSKVEGFTELMSSGGQVMADICRIVGEMAGSLIGGIGEGITASLPAIGENLSSFATSIQPMFETFSGVDTASLSDFATSFATFIAVIAGEKIVGLITGGIDYAGLGTKLSSMATGLSGFFTTIMTLPDGCFEKATALFNCLAGISAMPKEGGIVGWFEGEVDYAKMATGLNQLAGTAGAFATFQSIPEEAFTAATNLFNCLNGIGLLPNSGGVVQWFTGEVDYTGIATGLNALAGTTAFFAAVQAIPAEAFTAATNLFNCLSGIGALPNSGGIMQWFTGEVDYQSIADGVAILGGASMMAALTTITGIPAEAYTSLSALFDALAGIKQMPEQGGIFGWFTGDSTTGLTNVAGQLPGVATSIASFFTNLGGITDFTPIKSLFDTLSNIKIDSDAASKGFLGLGSSQLESMGAGLSSFATNAETFFTKINNLKLYKLKGFFSELSTVGELPTALSTLDSTVGTNLSNLVTTAETRLTELKGKFSDKLGEIVTLLELTATAMYSSGEAIMDGVNNGMESKRSTLVATAQSIAQAIQDAFDVKMDISSPSKETYKSGVFVGEGYNLGMKSKIPDLKATAADLGSASIPYSSRYSPESEGSTVTNNSTTSSEYTTIAPAFNLTISGTQDDRATARRVKQWVNESMQEFFASLDRKNTVMREV